MAQTSDRQAADMAADRGATGHEAAGRENVFELLRSDILGARLAPGQKLKVEELRQRYGTSASPLREALSRLTAEGLVELRERRGFRVAPVSQAELEELVRTRLWIEDLAIRECLKHGDVEWETALVMAFRSLARSPAGLRPDGRRQPDWVSAHREFHRALLSACPSAPLLNFARQLYDSAERYRELAAVIGERDDLSEHRDILDAALDRDAETASRLLADHIRKTADAIIAFIPP